MNNKILLPSYSNEITSQVQEAMAETKELSSQLKKTMAESKAIFHTTQPIIAKSDFPSILEFRKVQGLVQTINDFNVDESAFPSGVIADINNANIHISTVDVPENLANNITAVLKENDIFIEDTTSPSLKSKTISISTFEKYLQIIVVLITVAGFFYAIGHDYISDRATAAYQSQKLEDSHKQTQLLERIDSKLSKIERSISKEKY
ncbi:MAG: hypothetical protein PUF29_09515 [Anaerobutyricum hallii]|uniref:hypothetical protein n=1 Tax=Anaerobutyricum hallii TaxID=39488 RepID=UPI0024325921|nr:hypothetical protein [Anaerobutyricum hallii]MDD6588820.1 hypothetical protein [Anaerobutyricum hallii]